MSNLISRIRRALRTRRSAGAAHKGHRPLFKHKLIRRVRHKVLVEDKCVFVDSAEFFDLLKRAEAAVTLSHGYVNRGTYGTYIMRCGPNTVQVWEQLDDTHGQDQWYWMQVRGPAFDDKELFPVESYRLTEQRMTEALRRMT